VNWNLYAHESLKHQSKETWFSHIGEKRWVELHLLKEPIVPVLVSLDPNGDYYGWIKTGKEVPNMIYPKLFLLSMCFPYGVEAAERNGEGKIVRLTVIKREDE
jgi:hypothetical protein